MIFNHGPEPRSYNKESFPGVDMYDIYLRISPNDPLSHSNYKELEPHNPLFNSFIPLT